MREIFGTARLPAALVILLLAAPVLAQEGAVVKAVEFEGAVNLDVSSLKFKLRTKEGTRLSDKKLAEDVSTLHAHFLSVRTRIDAVEGGVKVVFILDEAPVIGSVVFQGFDALDEDELRAEVRTKQGFPFTQYRVQLDIRRLETLLKEKGHYFAEVHATVKQYEGGKQVVFTAIEGPEVEIDEIRVVGNEHVDEDEFLTKPWVGSEEGGLFGGGEFVLKSLEQDLVGIRAYYRYEGYLDVVVELGPLEFSEDREDVTVTILVDEGEPYLIEKVVVEGGLSFPEDRDRLTSLLKFEKDQRMREEDLHLTRLAIRNFYLENAFWNVQLRLVVDKDPERHRAVVKYQITEGEPATIRRIGISGNVLTREDVVRRNLSVTPGGPLNSIEIEKSKGRLQATRFFDPDISALIEDTEEPTVKDVVFALKEGRTGDLNLGVNWSSDFGFGTFIRLTKRNFDYADLPERFGDVIVGEAFTGGGQQLELQASPGLNRSEYRIAWTEPWFLEKYLFFGPSDEVEESPFSFGFDLFHRTFLTFDYDEIRTGASVNTAKHWRKPGSRIDDVWSVRLTYVHENVTIDDIDQGAPPNAYLFEGVNQLAKLRLGFYWSHVDLPASPGRGWDADLSYTLAGGPLGREVDFNKLEWGGTKYFTLHTDRREQRHLLRLKLRMGWSREFGASDQVPLFERFYAGGFTTVRGFKYGEVGPRAAGNPNTNRGRKLIRRSIASGHGDPAGGQAMWVARAEYDYPIIEQVLRGVLFVDAGNVTSTWNDDLLDTYRVSWGVGLRIKIQPVFGAIPFALDFAWPLREEEGDGTRVVTFTISRPFL